MSLAVGSRPEGRRAPGDQHVEQDAVIITIVRSSQMMSLSHPRLHMSVAVVQYVLRITSGAMNSRVPSIPHRSFSGPPSSFASPKSIILKVSKDLTRIKVFWFSVSLTSL